MSEPLIKNDSEIKRLKVKIGWINTDTDPIESDYVFCEVSLSIGESDDPYEIKVNDSRTAEYGTYRWLSDCVSSFYDLNGKELNFEDLHDLRVNTDFALDELYLLADCKITNIGGDMANDHYSVAVVDKEGNVISNGCILSDFELKDLIVTEEVAV